MANEYSFAEFMDKNSRLPESMQLLLQFARDEKVPAAIRVAAASAVVKVEPAYIYSQVDIPKFTNIKEAEDFKLWMAQREARRELDKQSVSIVMARIDNWIADQRADAASARADAELEIKRIHADVSDQPQIIKIEGGLPTLPGTNVTMPHQLNGNASDGLLTKQPLVVDHDPHPKSGDT
jgi:hypothetical protein